MPYIDGVELCNKIKGDKRTSQVPVILLTARTGEEDQLKGLKSGASDFLSKPFSFQILNTKIENLLALKKSLQDTYSKHIHLVEPHMETTSADVRLIDSVRKYIEAKLTHSDLSVEDLSKHVGMSRGSIYNKIIELTGLPPLEYMRSVKLEKAANLLESGNYNVAQVAYMTGFATPSYFTKMFKAKYGMVPSEYLQTKKQLAKD
jgi:AraC-like DNA-binding protein